MAADGVSLPTTIAQMGSVAKTQAKAQQPAQQVTPFSEQPDKKEELKVQRVKETPEAEQGKINPDEERRDRRQRRKLKRQRKLLADDGETEEQENSSEESDENQEGPGTLIDLRA